MMDPELGYEEEKELVRVKRERLMRMAQPNLPRTVAQADVGFLNSYSRGDYTTARLHLRVLKDWLKELKSLPPLFEETPNCVGELKLASLIHQSAVFMTISGDEDPAAFDEEFDQLKPYYACIDLIPPSSQRNQIFGYYLMRLLEKNRIADFHAELKSLRATDRADPYIQRAVNVEKFLSRCPTLDCKLLREIYRKELCGQFSRRLYIHPYAQKVMFSRPKEKPLPCVKEQEVLPRSEKSTRSKIKPLKTLLTESQRQSLTGPMKEEEVVLASEKLKKKPLRTLVTESVKHSMEVVPDSEESKLSSFEVAYLKIYVSGRKRSPLEKPTLGETILGDDTLVTT